MTAVRRIEQRVSAAGLPIQVEVIDVTADPDLAESERILATPTLVRESPPPRRRVIGDLSDTALAVAALDLDLDGREEF
jgi:circadian clock protein KaiB